MAEVIDRTALAQRLDQGAIQLVEVLPRPEYEWAHLPGASHLPLKDFRPEVLDHQRPVVVYCHDFP